MKGPKIWGFLLALCLVSCGTVRQVTNSDNTTVQVKTETVYHTDTIYVELPQIIQSIQTRDTLSRLENDYAKSEAVVSNGTLSHSLEIKPTAHPVKVQGKTVYKDSIVFRDRIVETQVEVEDGRVTSVILAVPCFKRDLPDLELDAACLVRKVIGRKPPKLTINGTGAYIRHGSIGDCGTTGRKLVVDFYGGNCRIGGGSPWTKDATKADLTLNIYARVKAREAVYKYGIDICYCAIACCIGRREITVTIFDGQNNQVATWQEMRPATEIIEELGLRKPVFAHKCLNGLFA